MMFILGMLAAVFLVIYLAVGYFFMIIMEHKGGLHWFIGWPIMLPYGYIRWKINERNQS